MLKPPKSREGTKMSSTFLNDENKGDIIIYQSESGETKIDVRFQDETVWLTQAQMEISVKNTFFTRKICASHKLVMRLKAAQEWGLLCTY